MLQGNQIPPSAAVVTKTVAVDVWGKTLTMTYDAVSNRTKVQDSFGGIMTSTYDGANNLTRREFGGATPLRIDLAYNANNQIENITRYSDLSGSTKVAYSTYLYDAVNRATSIIHRKGSDNSAIGNYTYTYDAGSRLTTEVINGTTKTYTYDAANQQTADGTNTFTYDGTGNRNNGSYTTGTGNRMTNDGVWTYTYDDEGNQTKRSKGASLETWTYGYDHKDQMVTFEKRASDGGTLQSKGEYKYNAEGSRIESKIDSNGDGTWDTTRRYALDSWKTGPQKSFVGTENADVWADLDGSSNLQTRYLRGDVVDHIYARLDSNAYWLLPDRMLNIRDITDNTGVVKDNLAYDGWGNITSETDSSFRGRYSWTSREHDTETELRYNRARYYDPKTGRWTSQDPLGFDAGDSNLYRYLNNRPINSSDPSGLQEKPGILPQFDSGSAYYFKVARDLWAKYRQKNPQPYLFLEGSHYYQKNPAHPFGINYERMPLADEPPLDFIKDIESFKQVPETYLDFLKLKPNPNLMDIVTNVGKNLPRKETGELDYKAARQLNVFSVLAKAAGESMVEQFNAAGAYQYWKGQVPGYLFYPSLGIGLGAYGAISYFYQYNQDLDAFAKETLKKHSPTFSHSLDSIPLPISFLGCSRSSIVN